MCSPGVQPYVVQSFPRITSPPVPVFYPSLPLSTGFQPLAFDFENQTYDDKDVGTKSEFKRLVETLNPLTHQWEKKEIKDGDPDPSKINSIEDIDQYCFVFRKKYTPNGPNREPTLVTYLDIKSWHLRQIGKDVIGNSTGISWGAKTLEIVSHSVLMYYAELRTSLVNLQHREDKSEDDLITVEHLTLLLSFLAEEFKDVLSELADLTRSKEITWNTIWALWKPGTLFLMPCPITELHFVVRLISAMPGSNDTWVVTYEHLDTQKNEFCLIQESVLVQKFRGRVPTTTLDVYPFDHYPTPITLKKQLIERGRQWKGLRGIHHLFYNGDGYMKDNKDRVRKTTVRSRVMVDKDSYQNHKSDYKLNPFFHADDIPVKISSYIPTPSDDDLLLSPTYVHGFSLVDKRWLMFNVESLSPVKFDPNAFQNLCIPKERKALLRSLVEAQNTSPAFDDIVVGKGKGLVINLFGPPGTGKTLTAEATSEHVKKPLYIVTAGELGSEAGSVGIMLNHIFSVCHRWNAVVLLDEADIFLERRSTHEVHRNAIVSVFLKELDYFEGILFLTTNRIETFDPAFQSRIHVSLRYRELKYRARLDVWRAILRKAGLHEDSLALHELRNLASRPQNGRQIRNVVRIAEAVAKSRAEPLDYGHLSEVKRISDKLEAKHEPPILSPTTIMRLAAITVVVGGLVFRQYRGLVR